MKVRIMQIHPIDGHFYSKDGVIGVVGDFTLDVDVPTMMVGDNCYWGGKFSTNNGNDGMDDIPFYFHAVKVAPLI